MDDYTHSKRRKLGEDSLLRTQKMKLPHRDHDKPVTGGYRIRILYPLLMDIVPDAGIEWEPEVERYNGPPTHDSNNLEVWSRWLNWLLST